MIKLTLAITRAVLGHQDARRKAMFYLILAAMLMLTAGWIWVVPQSKEHPIPVLLYWLACAWLTIAGVLLACLDLLLVRIALQREERRLRAELHGATKSDGGSQTKEQGREQSHQ